MHAGGPVALDEHIAAVGVDRSGHDRAQSIRQGAVGGDRRIVQGDDGRSLQEVLVCPGTMGGNARRFDRYVVCRDRRWKLRAGLFDSRIETEAARAKRGDGASVKEHRSAIVRHRPHGDVAGRQDRRSGRRQHAVRIARRHPMGKRAQSHGVTGSGDRATVQCDPSVQIRKRTHRVVGTGCADGDVCRGNRAIGGVEGRAVAPFGDRRATGHRGGRPGHDAQTITHGCGAADGTVRQADARSGVLHEDAAIVP